MPVHIYPGKVYSKDSPELKALIGELFKEFSRLKITEERVILEKDMDHVVEFVFTNNVLHFIEIRCLKGTEYRRIIKKIESFIKIYSLGWI